MAGALQSLAECDCLVRDDRKRAADFPSVPQFRSEDSPEGPAALAQGVCDWRLAGWRPAMAPDLHVDLHRDRPVLSGVPGLLRELPAGVICCPGRARCMADGPALFFLWPEAAHEASLQSSAKTHLHGGDRLGSAFRPDRIRGLEADPGFVACLDDGRFPPGPGVALRGHVGDYPFRAGTPGDGGAARVEQLCFHAYRVEV